MNEVTYIQIEQGQTHVVLERAFGLEGILILFWVGGLEALVRVPNFLWLAATVRVFVHFGSLCHPDSG